MTLTKQTPIGKIPEDREVVEKGGDEKMNQNLMKNLPKEWKWKELGEICEIYNGSTPSRNKSEYWGGEILWATPTDVSHLNSKYIEDTKSKITQEGYKSCSTHLLPVKSVIFTSRASIGHIAITKKELCTNQGFKNFVCNQEIIPEFLFYCLKIKKKEIENLASGSTFKEVSMNLIKKVRIPTPTLPVQKQIVSILERAEKLKEKRKDANEETSKLLQSIFLEMFGDPIKNPFKFKVKPLSKVVTINPKKSEIADLPDNLEISFIPMANVKETGKILLNENKKLGEVRKGFTYFGDDDVLFAKITPCMENGKGAIAKKLKNKLGFGSTEFHVLRPSEEANSHWIYYLLSLKTIRKDAAKNMTGTAGQKRVPVLYFNTLKIPIPPIELQNQFALIFEKVESLKENQQKSTEDINQLFDVLMQKAFNGELAG